MSSIIVKPNGTIIVTVRITLKPGRDDQIMELIDNAPRRGLASTIREAMRTGISNPENLYTEENELDLSGLGQDI